jgi:transglutaminase-like putative cysteine protease
VITHGPVSKAGFAVCPGGQRSTGGYANRGLKRRHDCRRRHVRLLTRALLLVLLSMPAALLQADDAEPQQSEQQEDWQVIFLQGQRVGYLYSRVWETQHDGQTRLWTETITRMSLKRFGAALSMTVTQLTQEDDRGNLLSFEYENDNPPISNSRITGRVDGDTLRLETTAAGQTTTATQPWDADVKSPVYQDRLLEQEPVQLGQTRTFKTFDPQLLKVGTVTIRGEEPAETTLLDGNARTLDRVTLKHSLVPGLTTTTYSDAEGKVLKTEANLLQMVTYAVPREKALEEVTGDLDLAVSTLVKVDRLDEPHAASRIVYRLTLDRPRTNFNLPTSLSQQVEKIDDRSYRITVTAIDPTDRPEVVIAIAADEEYYGSSRLLELQHPDVVRLADQAAGDRTDPVETALALERFVHQKLTSKNFSTALATAAEVAGTLEGDCTEHAVLLAALLRVRKIPSRVAIGLVYADSHSAFGGHMWTEAFLDARWVPLDATLGRGGIGGGHIKFADSSLDDDAPAPVTSFLPMISVLEHLDLEVEQVVRE